MTIAPRNIAAGIAVGIGYFYLYSFVIGFVAAIAFPDWYVPFAYNNKALSLALWDLVTMVPTIFLIALMSGFILSKLVSGQFLQTGFMALAAATAGFFLSSYPGLEFHQIVFGILLPAQPSQIPSFVAFYISLPFATWFWGRAAIAT